MRAELDRVHVPGPAHLRYGIQHEWTSAVHVLELGPLTPDSSDREWSIVHPPACPVYCYWAPAYGDSDEPMFGGAPEVRGDPTYHCPVAWELEGNGIDGLTDQDGLEWRAWRHGCGLGDTLPPGRYLVEAWAHDGAGQGEYGGQGDGDGSFTLLGPETPAGLTYPRDLLSPHVHFTTRPRRR